MNFLFAIFEYIKIMGNPPLSDLVAARIATYSIAFQLFQEVAMSSII